MDFATQNQAPELQDAAGRNKRKPEICEAAQNMFLWYAWDCMLVIAEIVRRILTVWIAQVPFHNTLPGLCQAFASTNGSSCLLLTRITTQMTSAAARVQPK